MSAPLNKDQKRYLSQLAARAFNRQEAIARGANVAFADGEYDGMAVTTAQEKFRHDEVARACGKLGLRCASQDDYKAIEGHFLGLLGNVRAAFTAHLQAQTETRRVIEYKIVEACRTYGFHLSYADKICRAQNKGQGLQEVSEARLWNIFYTIRNRGNSRTRPVNHKPKTTQPKESHEYANN